MNTSDTLNQFQRFLKEAISSGNFVKLSLGNYQGNDKGLKNLYVKPVKIKRVAMLSFNYRYQTRDIFKNFELNEGINLIEGLLSNDFKIGTLFTVQKEIIIEHHAKGKIVIRERELVAKLQPNLSHDKEKKRLIKPVANDYLHALKIADADGNVYKNAQDKYKQIN